MKIYNYNENIDYLEIDPQCLSEGLDYAERNNFNSIRICVLNFNSDSKYNLDLSPFENKVFIKRLIINGDFKVSPKIKIEPIYTLTNLKHFQFTHSIEVDFSKLPQLESLYLTYNKKIKNLHYLQQLQHLLVTSYKGEDCMFVSKLINLNILRFVRGTFTSLNGIQFLQKLQSLNITYCSKLKSASEIASLNINKLHVEKCKLLMDFSFLANNSSISDLFISKLDSLTFIQSMSQLEKINFWDCKDGNLLPLLKNKTLKTIWFTPDRKYYSHKKSEIQKLIS